MGSSAVLPRPAALAALLSVAWLAAVQPSPVLAASCGDDVGGSRVACACGDDVISDTTLSATDPVVSEPCQTDGLVVAVPRELTGITLNLGGLSIMGSGRGVGIRVVRGGSVGSTIVGGEPGAPAAEIANFRTGISASGRNALVEISGIYVHDNVGDGLRLHSSGVRIANVLTEKNGRDGISVLGHGVEVEGVIAEGNLSDGVQVRGSGASVSAEARGNSRHGLVISGQQNTVNDSATSGNGGAGIVTSGRDIEVGQLAIGENSGGDVKARGNAISGGAR